MSANPHNASLGLPENGSPENASPENEPPDYESPGNELPAGATAAPSLTAVSLGHTSFASHALGHEAFQALLAFSSLHEQLRRRRAREKSGEPLDADAWQLEHFVLDEVLQLVAERALTLTGADGVAIAMAEEDAIVCRAAAGISLRNWERGLIRNQDFPGACLRTGGIVRCDDSETDPRVNVQVCRLLGTRSIVAVPIASAYGTIGLLEAFSSEPHGFNDSDVRSLNLLAELILAALKPEEENRLAEISQRLVVGESDETSSSRVQDRVQGEILNDESASALAESSPEIFQEYGRNQKSISPCRCPSFHRFWEQPWGQDCGGSFITRFPHKFRRPRPHKLPRRSRNSLSLSRLLPHRRSRSSLSRSPRLQYRRPKTNSLPLLTKNILRGPWSPAYGTFRPPTPVL